MTGREQNGAKGRSRDRRRTALEETERLTNMASLIGAGVALVPIPGTALALRGIDILLMGAIAAVWGQPLTKSFVAACWNWIKARFFVGVGLAIAGDFLGMIPGVGTVLKPAIAGGCIKLMGSGMGEYLAQEVGKDHPAAITAEEARDRLKSATDRMAELAPDLKAGMEALLKGDGGPLAATLNRVFGGAGPAAQAKEADSGTEDAGAEWEDDDGLPPRG